MAAILGPTAVLLVVVRFALGVVSRLVVTRTVPGRAGLPLVAAS
ncbi:MAG TPA: hypothetical protein VNK94_11300 [Gaiellaceae bacterium]|nr:hypothetical protein [Gaiellaceae bacterium]